MSASPAGRSVVAVKPIELSAKVMLSNVTNRDCALPRIGSRSAPMMRSQSVRFITGPPGRLSRWGLIIDDHHRSALRAPVFADQLAFGAAHVAHRLGTRDPHETAELQRLSWYPERFLAHKTGGAEDGQYHYGVRAMRLGRDHAARE